MTKVEKNDVIKGTRPGTGIIIPPDNIPSAQIYNDKQATKNFKKLSKDVFENSGSINHRKDIKNLKGFLISTGIVASFYLLIKKFSRLKTF